MAVGIAADFLNKLCKVWRGKLALAKRAKKPWDDTRDQCMTFVCGGASDFWKEEFQRKFLGTEIPARFRLSMNKGFELIAVFGPMLYARNPVRNVFSQEPVKVDPAMFGDPNDPVAQQAYAQFMAIQNAETARANALCSVVERYLNYTPNEQPNGGLKQHAEQAITDALIGGMGLLWPTVYTMPGSPRKLTGCFYCSSDYFLADPDSRSLDFGPCTWIARLHCSPVWELERQFRLPTGSLKRWAFRESSHGQAASAAHELGRLRRIQGQTHDLMEWVEIWSIGGIGCRMNGADESLRNAFDETVGDYAYLALAFPGEMPYPLNCPVEALRTESVEDIQRRFRWPIPFWQDRRWPCGMLQFYRHPRNQFPIPPLGPGMGELIFMNLVVSRLANHVWQSSRQFIGVLESARKEVEKALERGADLVTIPIKDMNKSLDQVVSFLTYPNLVKDIYDVYDRMAANFERRTGLVEFLYAAASTQSRTATDVRAKAEKAGIRPDYMAHKVEDWLSEISAMEKLAAYWGELTSQDVAPFVGQSGGQIWDALFANADPEYIAREVYCRVAAGSARKRNREMELSSINQFYAPMSQQLTLYAQASGDSTPANVLNQKLFDALNYDGTGLAMGPFMPPAPPPSAGPEEEMAAEQELREAEHQAELEREDEKHEQKLQHTEEAHDQDLALKQEKGDLDLQIKAAMAAIQTEAKNAQLSRRAK